MQKKKSAVPAYLGVAAVWIGSHFGPGFATGAFSVRWYVKYGWIGLITPLLAMLVTGGVMYYMLEARNAELSSLCARLLWRKAWRRCGGSV